MSCERRFDRPARVGQSGADFFFRGFAFLNIDARSIPFDNILGLIAGLAYGAASSDTLHPPGAHALHVGKAPRLLTKSAIFSRWLRRLQDVLLLSISSPGGLPLEVPHIAAKVG